MNVVLVALVLLAAAPARDSAGVAPATADSSRAAAADSAAAPRDSLALRRVTDVSLAAMPESQGRVIEPAGLAIDPFGRIYVSDAASHRLQRFQRSFAWLGEAGALGSDPGQMRRPGSVAVLGTLGVGVLDRENRRVLTYDLFGRLIGTAVDLATPELESQIGRIDPLLLAADRGGAIAVVDGDRERLLIFDFAGRFVRPIGGFGAKPGLFRGVRGIAYAPRGEIVVAERVNARVQRLDAGGRVVASWPLPVGPGGGGLPVAVDEAGRVAVADEATGRLWVFAPGGGRLAFLAGLAHPRALAFDPDGTLLVAEGAPPARLVRFRLEAPSARTE